MKYKYYNPNPKRNQIGDCVIRALTMALGLSWKEVYVKLVLYGFRMSDMPSSNRVWGQMLEENGFSRHAVEGDITVKEFAKENPIGLFVLATGSHVVTMIHGQYFDSWDSGDESVIYYFKEVNEFA